jgi:hypothetical protein
MAQVAGSDLLVSKFVAAMDTVVVIRFSLVSGLFAFAIHSRMMRFELGIKIHIGI